MCVVCDKPINGAPVEIGVETSSHGNVMVAVCVGCLVFMPAEEFYASMKLGLEKKGVKL